MMSQRRIIAFSSVFLIFLVLFILLAYLLDGDRAKSDEFPMICYNERCFQEFADTNYTPWCTCKNVVRYYLFTWSNRDKAQILHNSTIPVTSNIDTSKDTVFLVHGYQGSWKHSLLTRLKNTLLDKFDINVFMVDWKDGASSSNGYSQACANTLSTGVSMAQFIDGLTQSQNADFTKIHCVGYSLGAHVCGFCGKELLNITSGDSIARITGLDAAGPGFENNSESYRLDSQDAPFVDVIHTDTASYSGDLPTYTGWGIRKAIGHVDYYVNGGRSQPQCHSTSFCSHRSSVTYFTNSISDWWDPSMTSKENRCLIGYYVNVTCRGQYAPVTESVHPYRPVLPQDLYHGNS